MVKRRIVINSKDREEGNSGNFTVNIPTHFDNNSTCRVISAIIPNTYYTFNSHNNIVAIQTDGTEYKIEMPTDRYFASGDDIAVELELLLKEIDVDFEVTFSNTTHRLTIVNTEATMDNVGDFSVNFDASTANSILGFTGIGGTVSSLSFTGASNVDLNPNRSLLVHCDAIRGGYSTTSRTKSDILCHVPVNVATGEYISYYPSVKETFEITRDTLVSSLKIYITDWENRVIDFNGINCELVLEFN